jgi:hypothetical protein
MDMHFDEGTTKLVDSSEGPVLVESAGFVVVARVATQEQARAAKKAVRALGPEWVEVDYQPVARPI